MQRFTPLLALAAAALLVGCGQPAPKADAPAQASVVNVYSSRHYDADAAIFAQFETETGIAVRTLEAPGDQLIERLRAEGAASPADVILTVDAGNLWRLTQAQMLQPVASEAIAAAVPANLRDPEGRWVGLSKRARVIVYAKDRIKPEAVATYDALAKPALKGKICARSSTNVYNLSLLAARIERKGMADALAWAKGVAANLARPPQGGDTDQIKALAAGVCDVAISNHYYLVRLQTSADPIDREAAAKVGLVFPDQAGDGAHVNVSGAGVAANAPNRDAAVKLLEYLVGPAAQAEFAALNDEYPVRADVALPPELAGLGAFKEDPLPLAALGQRQAEAQKLFDEAGWR